NRVRVGIAVSKAQSGQLQLKWNGQLFCQEAVHLAPEEPLLFEASLPAGAQRPGQLGVLLHGQGGTTLLQYEATF
ncbi:MAG: hypothetical protein ACPLRM_05440, partial [Anaerolineae bacterium]